MRIVSRAEWGAQPARSRYAIDTPTPRLWLHHTAGALDAGGNGVWWDDVRGIQDFHMRPISEGGRGWSDIAYSFLVGGGQVFEGRGVGIAGGHTKGDNTESHAICLIGDYSWMTPKAEDLEAIAWLIGHGQAQGWWGDLTGPHRDAPGAMTACCGDNLVARISDLRRMAASPMEDSMSAAEVNDIKAHVDAAQDATRQWIREELKRTATTLTREIRAGKIDAATLAEELARRLPGTIGPVKVADLEEALRNVLGSLDEGTG